MDFVLDEDDVFAAIFAMDCWGILLQVSSCWPTIPTATAANAFKKDDDDAGASSSTTSASLVLPLVGELSQCISTVNLSISLDPSQSLSLSLDLDVNLNLYFNILIYLSSGGTKRFDGSIVGTQWWCYREGMGSGEGE